MAVNLSPVGGVAAQFFTNNAVPLSGGKLYTYAAGTTTPQVAYTTSQGNIAWTNPIVLDAGGRVPGSGEVWLTDGLIYKFVLKDANDVLIATYDNITGINPSVDACDVSYTPSFSGSVSTFVCNKLEQYVSVKDFGAVGDNSTDDTTAFQAAIAYVNSTTSGCGLYIPRGRYVISSTLSAFTKPVEVYGDGWASIVKATGTTISAVFETNAGAAGSIFRDIAIYGSKTTTGGTIQRGIYFNGAKYCKAFNVLLSGPSNGIGLNFGFDINGVASGNSTIQNCRIERMVSSSGNGTAILIEASNFNTIVNNVIDSSEFNNADSAPGSAIFLSAQIGGNGSTYNLIQNNRIVNHPQAGIDINSTTYWQFAAQLGACDYNVIQGNNISYCDHPSGGDAASGIVIVGNSNYNRIVGNEVFLCGATAGGYGIVISGSQQGTPNPGQPKLDEHPIGTEIFNNYVHNNYADGIKINGALNSVVKANYCIDNGQLTANTYYNINITAVGGTTTGSGSVVMDNVCKGVQPAYQIGVTNALVTDTILQNNCIPVAASGAIYDIGGANSVNANGGFSTSGKTRFSSVPVGSVAYASFGTNTTPVAGTLYVSDVYVVRNTTLTGIGLLNGATAGGTNTVIYALYNSQGKLIANSDLSGTSTSGANSFQQIAFTSAINVEAGKYFIAVQRNGTTDTLRTVAANTFVDVVSTSVAGVFGTIPASITAPTSFSADVGPIAYVY